MRCPAKCRRVGMADEADSKSVGGNTVWVQVPPPAPRRNGLRSIQKAQPKGWAFLIPLRHSSFSPRNFASQIFAGALAALPGGKRASCVSLAATFFTKNHRALILLLLASPPCRATTHCAPFRKPGRLAGLSLYIENHSLGEWFKRRLMSIMEKEKLPLLYWECGLPTAQASKGRSFKNERRK